MDFVIPPCSPKKAPSIRRMFELAVSGRLDVIQRREVEKEIRRFLKGVGTEEEQLREARSLQTLLGIVMLTSETIWKVKRGMLNPCGSLGKS